MSAVVTLAVIGCGVVGGSVALAGAAVDGVRRVAVTDRDPAVREVARQRGIGTAVTDTVAEAVAGADLVILAVPTPAIGMLLPEVCAALEPDATVTDVAGLKVPVLDAVARFAATPDGAGLAARFVGGHPMAGSERSGPAAADPTLFQGATWVLTPDTAVDQERFRRLAAFVRGLGARVLAVDAELHDRLVATTSHLPQVLASTLMTEAGGLAASAGDAALTVTGGGFRDVTRIAASDPDLWVDILAGNRAAVVDALDGFAAALGELRAAMAAEDWPRVRGLLDAGRTARAALPSMKGVGEPVAVVVPVVDEPGMLVAVTTALGEAGVNIEDLWMRHAEAGDRGALVVEVDGQAAAERAADLLTGRGLACHLERDEPGQGPG